jgi:nucleoside-diphosphate-sugar epimerase
VRLLITGGAGFIGSHFVKRMVAAGEDVVVLDKFTYAGNQANLPADIACYRGDIAAREDVDQIGRVDAIVNFAAETHVDRSILGPEEFVRTDVLGALVLLQAAEEQSARFVQVSTDEVYGDVEAGWSSREDDPLRPSSPYSASKAGGDLQVLSARSASTRRLHAVRTPMGPTSTRKRSCPCSRRTHSTASRCRCTAMAGKCATGCTSTTIAQRSSSFSAREKPATSTTSAPARSTRTSS